ncbi:hypothetical protein BH24ACI3_BH24ACI3_17190 [soil metagenome]
MKETNAVILAGGKGTRLRPLTVYAPKPIVPLVNRPFLLYQLELLARSGTQNVVLSLSYQPNKIEDALASYDADGIDLKFTTEPNPLGTAGAFRFAADEAAETFIVFNGDILTDVDISKILNRHRDAKADATIVLARVEDPSRYGLVETDDEGRVLRFREKPTPEELAKLDINTINAGIYILDRKVLERIPKNENSSFEYNVFPGLLEDKLNFYSYILDGEYWRDIGTPTSYLDGHMDFLAGKIKGFTIGGAATEVATAADICSNSVLGEGCIVKPNAHIINSVLGPGVRVEEKAVIENSVIWAHTRVSTLAEIRGAIISRSCHIGRNVIVNPGAVLGDKASLSDYSVV